MSNREQLLNLVQKRHDRESFKQQHWEGSFWDYLELVHQHPRIARNAFQRIYDMIMSFGVTKYTSFRTEFTRYNFFSDPIDGGADGIFGLDRALMQLVAFIRSAAEGYGTDKRILLLHGPVGSSKSTIARLIKKGLEYYSGTDEGALYSFAWAIEEDGQPVLHPCPMHEEPLLLIPAEARGDLVSSLNAAYSEQGGTGRLGLTQDVCPFCRKVYSDLMLQHDGDWEQVINHIRVRRIGLSEKDRVGIGTFQPKDEKNQDSTELTGDINYRKIAQYGSDSDPRAFNFDGELNIANRGICEFIEVLKLDVAFLYDLLGASQEHLIKPKKFARRTSTR
jgi:serine protein kinase